MNNRKRKILIVSIILAIQTIIFVIVGINKSYIHMDEAYSLGLASYEKTEIQNNQDFYNTWHNNKYYEDYISVGDNETGEYAQVYENQKNDVHPPLYYLLLRIAMGFSRNHFSKWSGIMINIIIYLFITIFMYLILQKLLQSQKNNKEKAIVLAFVSSLTVASLSNAIYIRMYALSTLNILITTFLHLKLIDTDKVSAKFLLLTGFSIVAGVLTHYYYLFYLAGLYLLFFIKHMKEKSFKEIGYYTLTMCISGIVSLVIFPYSIKHMFFGYRGQGVINKLVDVKNFCNCLLEYLLKINYFAFNGLMFVFLSLVLALLFYKLIKKEKITAERNKYTKFIIFPTLIYFILVSVSSPWIELRYMMPISGLVFALVIYYLYNIMHSIFGEKKGNIAILLLLIIVLVAPLLMKIEPEVMYSDKKEIVEKSEYELNIPTIYFFNSNNNRFLDDILLFSKLDESYIAKDMEYIETNIQEILKGKNVSNGFLIFINEGQENDKIVDISKKAMNLNEFEHIKRLNACDVYYIH